MSKIIIETLRQLALREILDWLEAEKFEIEGRKSRTMDVCNVDALIAKIKELRIKEN